MKKLKFLPLAAIVTLIVYSLGFNLYEQVLTWDPVTIQFFQFKSTDSLALGKDRSDKLGDSVEFVARVVAPPRVSPATNDFRTLLRGSSSWTCYVQDTANGIFGGIVIRQGGRGPQTGLDLVDTGAIIKVRGLVQEFPATGYSNSLTQVDHDTTSGYTINVLQSTGSRPVPKLVNITDFNQGDYPNGGTINYVGGEKYEGMYVELRNVTIGTGLGNRQPWSVVDENGNKLYMRDFSNFFSTQPSGDTLRPWTHPLAGTYVNYVRGVIIAANNEGAFGTQLPYAIVPLYPSDLSLGNAPPQISSVTRNPGVPTPSDSVSVTCSVIDPALNPLTISEVRVFWKVNGGAFDSKVMPFVTGNLYSAKMPPQALGNLVEYFIKATDNSGGSKNFPADTLKSKLFYKVYANDSLSIQDVQWCPNNGGFSGYNGATVRGIEGIVTADTSDIRAFSYSSSGGSQTSPRRVIIQNGTGVWSGIWVYNNATDVLKRGDRVRVKGVVEESNGMTRINVAAASDITLISTGNPLPAAQNLTTAELANNKLDGDSTIEKWESVFIRFNTPFWITCINAGSGISCTSRQTLIDTAFRRNFGEILVRDNSNIDSRIELQDGGHTFTNNWDGVTAGKTLLTQNDSILFTQGILYYSFGNYKMVPRRNTDFGTVIPVGIINNNEIVKSYSLSQNYPNPFNPVTKIRFTLPVNSNVRITVYNVLGKEVAKLVDRSMPVGSFTVDWTANNFASGVYFYKVVAEGNDGSRFVNTKRMILIK
ncbi:MAG: T9SS type A sorting domain-containing protein [Candidatus Kapaibacterium sp.]